MSPHFKALAALFVYWTVLSLSSPAKAETVPAKLNAGEARQIASEAAMGTAKYAKSFDEDDNVAESEFYRLDELGKTMGIAGWFAVNRWTGTVWSLTDCKKISTPQSIASQKKIRGRFTPSELKQYDTLNGLTPECF